MPLAGHRKRFQGVPRTLTHPTTKPVQSLTSHHRPSRRIYPNILEYRDFFSITHIIFLYRTYAQAPSSAGNRQLSNAPYQASADAQQAARNAI